MTQLSPTHLALQVRTADYERFLSIQLAPAAKREALYAVTAFHAELARIAETVSEPLLGHIRLAWWREALEEIMGGTMPRNHPVVLALAELHRAQPELLPHVLPMVEARAADLDSSLLATEDAWLHYLDSTAGTLHSAWAQILDAAYAATHAETIQREARGYAILGLIRAMPYLAAHGFMRFPEPWMAQAGITELTPSPQLSALAEQLADRARSYLVPTHPWPKTLAPIRGLASLAEHHLRALQQNTYNPYQLRPARLALVLRILQVKFFLC